VKFRKTKKEEKNNKQPMGKLMSFNPLKIITEEVAEAPVPVLIDDDKYSYIYTQLKRQLQRGVVDG
jgi:hypothetical protein